MSSKFGLMLSMFFVVAFLLFGIDMIGIQFTYSELDQKAISISYLISKRGNIDDEYITSLENKYDVKFTCLSNCQPMFGDIVEYKLEDVYRPLVISKNEMVVSVYRSTVIGYYN